MAGETVQVILQSCEISNSTSQEIQLKATGEDLPSLIFANATVTQNDPMTLTLTLQ